LVPNLCLNKKVNIYLGKMVESIPEIAKDWKGPCMFAGYQCRHE